MSSDAALDLWRGKSRRPVVEDELSCRKGWKNASVQLYCFVWFSCVKYRSIYTSFSPVPRVEGAGRTAELYLEAEFPSERAPVRPAGGTDVQKQWAGRCAATGTGRVGWWRTLISSSNAGSLRRWGKTHRHKTNQTSVPRRRLTSTHPPEITSVSVHCRHELVSFSCKDCRMWYCWTLHV